MRRSSPSRLRSRIASPSSASRRTAGSPCSFSRPERLDPPRRLLRQAIEAGCLLSIDSDAHAPGQLAFLEHGAARAAECGADPDRVVTTWPVQRLLAWTADHSREAR